ncbi:craniofacial development protein 2-like [Elysia marginata]|uniref:Craniofacial development protein 2-like n=1 Tax=Elysia marginata TaxID=1093978 RepID=A0AAV4JPH6_9GAST|nr:craniofacial development protein 2-like [Elysia marginata]
MDRYLDAVSGLACLHDRASCAGGSIILQLRSPKADRLKGRGQTKLDPIAPTRVAIILKKGLEKSIMEWNPVNSRLIKIRLKERHNNLSIIQCYAPTNDSDEGDKDMFYEQMLGGLSEIPCHDVTILMGDLNAKVVDNNYYSGDERTMGQRGCASINNNGERLVDFCAANDLVIGGTLFKHPVVHKLTWYSPKGRYKNQIDHIAINGSWRGSMLDVRVKRGADVDSDHLLVTANIRLKLRITDRRCADHRRLYVNREEDPDVRQSVIIQLTDRFQTLSEQENSKPQEMNVESG